MALTDADKEWLEKTMSAQREEVRKRLEVVLKGDDFIKLAQVAQSDCGPGDRFYYEKILSTCVLHVLQEIALVHSLICFQDSKQTHHV